MEFEEELRKLRCQTNKTKQNLSFYLFQSPDVSLPFPHQVRAGGDPQADCEHPAEGDGSASVVRSLAVWLRGRKQRTLLQEHAQADGEGEPLWVSDWRFGGISIT